MKYLSPCMSYKAARWRGFVIALHLVAKPMRLSGSTSSASVREVGRQKALRVRRGRRNLDPYRRNPSAGASSARSDPRFSTIGSVAVSRSSRSGRRGGESEGRDFPVNLALGAFSRGFR